MKLVFVVVAALSGPLCCAAAEAEFRREVITARETAVSPVIDGALDDDCWQACTRIAGFKESYYGKDPAEQTEVMVCRDAAGLYFAFICHDSRPELIHAEQTQRDSDLYNDDYVGVLLDPQNTHLNHYHFEANALGAQNQSVPVGAAGNITWRGDWLAAARIASDGWQAEMAIPYDALRYPRGATAFGLSFRRYIPRIDELSAWPDVGSPLDQTRFAELIGLDPPAQRARPVLMPYAVTSTEPGRSFTVMGLDFKEELPNNLIAMATYNPDFTDVQDAVASLSYSYVEQYLPERRPFFQEGTALFPDSNAFYSRRIGDIDFGVKSFGKVGPHAFGLMGAMRRGSDSHFAGSYALDIGQDAGVSLNFAGSMVRPAYKADPGEPDTSLCISPGGYLQWRRPSGITTLGLRHYQSVNSSGGGGSLLTFSLGKSAAAGNLGYSIGYEDIDSDYYVRDAYVPLTGIRGGYAQLNYMNKPSGGRLNAWSAYTSWRQRWHQSGGVHSKSVTAGISLNTRSEYVLGLSASTGEWLGLADSLAAFQFGWRTRHLYGWGSLGYSVGKKSGEDYTYCWADQSFRLTPRIALSCGFEWSRLGGPTGGSNSQFTVLGNYEINPDRSIGLWTVGRGSDVNMCLTYRQTVRSGSDIYLIFGYPNTQTTEQRIALKVVTPVTW